MSSSPYTRYSYTTSELISKFKPALSNTFDVYVNHPPMAWKNRPVSFEEIHFMAYEAVLPGTSYELGQTYGDRQGRNEYYPTRRSYPPVDVSFYVDKDYSVIRYFEQWINSATVNRGTNVDSYVTHNYHNAYEGSVTIAKYERDLRSSASRLGRPQSARPGSVLKYTLRNAFPSNLISIPVSYEGASILKTTVTFQYDVYFFEYNNGPIENVDGQLGVTSGDQGDTSESTNPELPQQQPAGDNRFLGPPTAKTFLGEPLNSQQTLNELYQAGRDGKIKNAGDFVGPLQ